MSVFFFFSFVILFPRSSTLFPYTTLFRSLVEGARGDQPLMQLFAAHTERVLQTLVGPRAVAIERDREAVDFQFRRSEEHTSELQSPCNLVCRLLLEKKNKKTNNIQRQTNT